MLLGATSTLAYAIDPTPITSQSAAPDPSASPDPNATPTTPPLPVTVLIDTLDPKAPTPKDTLKLQGRIEAGPQDVFDLTYTVRIGQVLSRFDLHRLTTTPETPQGIWGQPVEGPQQIIGGESQKFSIELPLSSAPFLGIDGVHALQIVVYGHVKDGFNTVIGKTNTFLPVFRNEPGPAPTKIVWAVPVSARPQAQPTGAISELNVLDLLGAHGRLSRVLEAATSTAGAKDSTRGTAAPAVTFLLDPDLLRALAATTRARWKVPGSDDVHPPNNAAVGFLTALARAAKKDDVVALPPADADVVSLVEAGLDQEAERALTEGRLGVQQILGVKAREDVFAPAEGLLSPKSIAFLAKNAELLLLSAETLPPRPDSEIGGITPTALSHIAVDETPTTDPNVAAGTALAPGAETPSINALVGDQYLNDLVARGDKSAPTARMAEQLFLAETAMITSQRPAISQSLLVTPPLDWDPGQRFGRAVIADSAAVPWLDASSIDEVSDGIDETNLRTAPVTNLANLLSADLLGSIVEARMALESFTGSFTAGAVDTVTGSVQRALFAAESARWRGDIGEALSRASVATRAVDALKASVRAAAPKVVTLTNESSPIPVTVINELPLSVTVNVRIQANNRTRLSDRSYVQPVTVAANSKVRVDIPVKVESSGTFPVTVAVETLKGSALGTPAKFVVRSAAYGKIALWITGGGVAILFLAVIRRWIRRWRGKGEPTKEPVVIGEPILGPLGDTVGLDGAIETSNDDQPEPEPSTDAEPTGPASS